MATMTLSTNRYLHEARIRRTRKRACVEHNNNRKIAQLVASELMMCGVVRNNINEKSPPGCYGDVGSPLVCKSKERKWVRDFDCRLKHLNLTTLIVNSFYYWHLSFAATTLSANLYTSYIILAYILIIISPYSEPLVRIITLFLLGYLHSLPSKNRVKSSTPFNLLYYFLSPVS